MLARATGLALHYVVPTGGRKKGGPPTHYKLDLAAPLLKLAVEVDGNSHCPLNRKAQDRKKEAWLRGAGWTVLRFTNAEVLDDTATCAQTVWSTICRLRAASTSQADG
jgi:very-short-patch-repair endonuclease